MSFQAPAEFLAALESLKGHTFRPQIHVQQVPPPKKIAPWSVALQAEVNDSPTLDPDFYRGEAKFVVLYDPEGQNAWNSTFRIVAHAQAPIEADISIDPLFGSVAWSYLEEALSAAYAPYHSLTGNVSRTFEETFTPDASPTRASIAVRASWSPADEHLHEHLQAWASWVAQLCGLAPEGVTSLGDFHKRAAR